MISMDTTKEETRLWQQYQNGLGYQRDMGFASKFPEYERFKQGDQWPAATKRTKNLPRPVFNIVDFFVRSKKANILNQNLKLMYTSTEDTTAEGDSDGLAVQGAKDFTDFAANLWEQLDQEGLNDAFIEDAATLGTGILHYYWDGDVKGGAQFQYIGDLRGEVIDPVNIFFGNPQERSLQKQPWILISSRDDVKGVRKLAAQNGVPPALLELIRPDDETREEGYDAAQHEPGDGKKITVLTKYYKVRGEVYYTKATRFVTLVEGRSLTPVSQDRPQEDRSDTQEVSEPDIPVKRKGEGRFAITLYPLVLMPWRGRKKCIFGSGEVEDILPNQKAINFNMAMMLLSVQQTAWPKILSKQGAVRQPITNSPGEQIVDYSQGGGDGVKYMQPPNFPYMAVNLVDKVLDLSRMTSGVTQVTTGEQIGANMAASAIIALQNQAKAPIQNIQQKFYRAMKDAGRIWEQFFKTYYTLPRRIIVEGADGRIENREFLGTDYSNVEFSTRVDVGTASTYSEALAVSTLDRFYDRKEITLDQYIELAPLNVVPFREQLKKMRQEERRQADAVQEEMPVTGGEAAAGDGLFNYLPPSKAVPFMRGGMGNAVSQMRP